MAGLRSDYHLQLEIAQRHKENVAMNGEGTVELVYNLP